MLAHRKTKSRRMDEREIGERAFCAPARRKGRLLFFALALGTEQNPNGVSRVTDQMLFGADGT